MVRELVASGNMVCAGHPSNDQINVWATDPVYHPVKRWFAGTEADCSDSCVQIADFDGRSSDSRGFGYRRFCAIA